ncbi:ATP-grasp domain-containing protein [Pseudarthrobacter sp. J1763]|uniref:ATP-grasp domain-containing protein n=1 Tax=Pseudarthrobacter sp. J1763 TaxID=3420445 RepID=UPI003D29B494
MKRILVTGCAGPVGVALGQQLLAQGHYVIGVDINAKAPAPASERHRIVSASHPGMVQALYSIACRTRADLVIPTVSEELPVLARAVADGEFPTPTVISPPEGVDVANDKFFTMMALASKRIPVPLFGLPSEFVCLEDAFRELGAPLILKPRVSRGGRGVQVIDPGSRLDWASLDDSLIVQEFAPGTEFAPVVHMPRGTGEPRTFVLQKTGLKEGRVGNATGVELVPSWRQPAVGVLAARTAAALCLTGPVDVDIRMRANGTPVVLEVNARFGANSRSAPRLLEHVLCDFLPKVP